MAAGQFSTTLVLETSGIVSLELATARLQSRRRIGATRPPNWVEFILRTHPRRLNLSSWGFLGR